MRRYQMAFNLPFPQPLSAPRLLIDSLLPLTSVSEGRNGSDSVFMILI